MELGRIGVLSPELRLTGPVACRDAVAELEALGYGAFWIPGGPDGADIINVIGALLSGSTSIVGAAAILNVWAREAADVAAEHAAVTAAHPGRFVLGLGAGHPNVVEARGLRYENVVGVTGGFLDGLDAATPPVPRDERMLAALGPRMLELAGDRTAGTIPYLFTSERTRWARGIVGERALLAPAIAVLLEDDAERARAAGRGFLERYLGMANYTRSLRQQGMTDDDLSDGGSDRLVDALIAWGDVDAIAERIREHEDAGADHVSLQVLVHDAGATPLPLDEWRRLAVLIEGTAS
jgi:probable F420-dependent oxidoreductase